MAKLKAGTDLQADDHAATVEHELMFLSRTLEALQRKRRYPLERAEFIILRTLSEGGAATVGGLAKVLLLDDSTMTRQVAVLEGKGLVKRAPNPMDRRAGLIAVTPRGEAMMRDMLALRRERVGLYIADWQPSERAAFGVLLGRLNARLVEALGE
jgi:DNA-binding MarR family transcriptional regulator